MDGKLNDREFSRFLKENADNHRLYPSEEVWSRIHAKLHSRKRWLAAGLSLLFFTGLTVSVVMLTNPLVSPSTPLSQQNKPCATPCGCKVPQWSNTPLKSYHYIVAIGFTRNLRRF